MDAGADIIFTMLNAVRQGVSDACRSRKVRQIGNIIDWTKIDSEVFMASAIADVSKGVLMAAQDEVSGRWKPGVIRKLGLADAAAVRLAMAADVPASVRKQIEQYAQDIISGKIIVPTIYNGPEFTLTQ